MDFYLSRFYLVIAEMRFRKPLIFHRLCCILMQILYMDVLLIYIYKLMKNIKNKFCRVLRLRTYLSFAYANNTWNFHLEIFIHNNINYRQTVTHMGAVQWNDRRRSTHMCTSFGGTFFYVWCDISWDGNYPSYLIHWINWIKWIEPWFTFGESILSPAEQMNQIWHINGQTEGYGAYFPLTLS